MTWLIVVSSVAGLIYAIFRYWLVGPELAAGDYIGAYVITWFIVGFFELFVFDLFWPGLTNKTMIRFRIVLMGDGVYDGQFRLMYKHWPWSLWWSDAAALEGWNPFDSYTIFDTVEKAKLRIAEIMAERRKVYKNTVVEEINKP